MTLVTHGNFDRVLSTLSQKGVLSCDTETTGLRRFHGDRLFSIIIGDNQEGFYFNFLDYPDAPPPLDHHHLEKLRPIFAEKKREWVFQNCKFDVGMLAQEGIDVHGQWWDVSIIERLLNSLLMQGDFKLDKIAKRYGYEKSTAVDEWMSENNAVTKVEIPGKATAESRPHFDLVPFKIIVPYGIRDQQITHKIRDKQYLRIMHMMENRHPGQPSIEALVRNEMALAKVVYQMETEGVLIDRRYCAEAIEGQRKIDEDSRADFWKRTGHTYKSSGKLFKEVFASEKDKWVLGEPTKTGKRNPKFDADHLKKFDNPVASTIIRIKKAKSNLDYFNGFLYHADSDGYLHGSLNQHAARTGRFTSSKPNMQNMTKDKNNEMEWPVRRAIVPEPDHFFGMIDYDQMEYYLLLDYCRAIALIEKVKAGLDVHAATAELAGIIRDHAKNTNFASIYGSGDAGLAGMLKTSVEEARRIKNSVLDASPEIRDFIGQVKFNATHRKMLWNWFGRVYQFPQKNMVYKSVNTLIQGGCADIVKIAMVRCAKYLAEHHFKTKLVLSIHDELVFHGPMDELHVLPKLKKIMIDAYPYKHIQLSAGIDVSTKSLQDKIPYEKFMEDYCGSLRENGGLARSHSVQEEA